MQSSKSVQRCAFYFGVAGVSLPWHSPGCAPLGICQFVGVGAGAFLRKVKEGFFMELQVVYLSPDELTPYEGNTRKHAPDDIEQIKQSIQADGFNDPIGIWGEKNLIVEGHGRQIAAKELGLDKVPCIRLDHLTDTQRRDYAIRHNRTAELSAWDFGKLEEEIARLEIEGVDLSGLKFTFDFDAQAEFDESDLDDESEKSNVIVTVNFKNVSDYEKAKPGLQSIADSYGASLAVKMA